MRLLTAILTLALLAGGGVPRPWWETVRADIEQFKRPITDRAAAAKASDQPVVRRERVFCPHDDRSPLRVRALSGPPDPQVANPLIETAYYCEIERVYWVHVQGGPAGLNLVTGPFTAGVASAAPASAPASRPAANALTLRLEREPSRLPPRTGEAIPVTLVFTNASDQPLWVNANVAGATLQFDVRGGRVENRPLAPAAAPAPVAADFVRLEPGASHRIPLRDLESARQKHRLTLGGTYLVRVTYRNDHDGAAFGLSAWTGSVTSESLVIEVAGPASGT